MLLAMAFLLFAERKRERLASGGATDGFAAQQLQRQLLQEMQLPDIYSDAIHKHRIQKVTYKTHAIKMQPRNSKYVL